MYLFRPYPKEWGIDRHRHREMGIEWHLYYGGRRILPVWEREKKRASFA